MIENPEGNQSHKILFVCTSCEITSYGAKSGVWLDEISAPYYIFREAGYSIEICSIAGSAPPIDPGSMSGGAYPFENEKFLDDKEATDIFHRAPSLSHLIKEDCIKSYACLYLVGGHGSIDDFFNNDDIKQAVEYFYDHIGGCIAAICHGNLGLVHCTYKGSPLLKGKFVAAFSNEEEEWLGLIGLVKIKTEDAMDQCGAICVPCEPWRPHAVVDGRLVTGQNPQSSLELAQRVLDVLRTLGPQFNAPENINKPWGK